MHKKYTKRIIYIKKFSFKLIKLIVNYEKQKF